MDLINENDDVRNQLGKQELDNTFKGNDASESGVFSNSDASSNSWYECIKGEVVDFDIFHPPLCSTDLEGERTCNISSIEMESQNAYIRNINQGKNTYTDTHFVHVNHE